MDMSSLFGPTLGTIPNYKRDRYVHCVLTGAHILPYNLIQGALQAPLITTNEPSKYA